MRRILLVWYGMMLASYVIAIESPIVLGNHEFKVLRGNQVSISFKGRGWTLYPDISNIDSEGSLITLLALREETDSTEFIFFRDDIGTDTLAFRKYDLHTGELYTYVLVLQWIETPNDVVNVYQDDNILITQKPMSESQINSNNNIFHDTAPPFTEHDILTLTTDKDTLDTSTESSTFSSNKNDTANSASKNITNTRTNNTSKTNTTKKPTRHSVPTRNNKGTNNSSNSVGTQTKNEPVLESSGIVLKNDALQNKMIQKDEIIRMSKNDFLSSLNTLWKKDRQAGEQFALQWISAQKDANPEMSAAGYFALAQKFETTPIRHHDILKALQYYTYIVDIYPLSSVYNDARARITVLQNGYIFIR